MGIPRLCGMVFESKYGLEVSCRRDVEPRTGLSSVDWVSTLEVKKIKSGEALEKTIKNGITLINFSAPWYAPCNLQEPIIYKLAAQFEGKVLIAAMNIDESQDVALKLGIYSIPTLIIFKNGKEIQRLVGLHSKAVLSESLRKLL
jgi:thioredoxin 1